MSLVPYEHHAGIFIKADADRIAASLMEWGRPAGMFRAIEYVRISFGRVWTILQDRVTPPDRAILVPHGNGWTAFFDNDVHEHLSSNVGYNLCRLLCVPVFEFYYDSRCGSPHNGSAVFRAIRCGPGDLPVQRTVMLYKEPNWKLIEEGRPVPCERLAAYRAPRKRDRLTLEMLRSYAESAGIRISNPAAYEDRVIILRDGEERGPDVNSSLSTIQEVFDRKLLLKHPRIC
jgi:hypothetical protein